MALNNSPAINQVRLLIIIFCILAIIAAVPVVPSARRLAYKISCSYYNSPPRWSIIRLFDNYAENFDEHLTKKLEYHTPTELTEFIASNTSLTSPIKKVLDLGCGTGLLGEALTKEFSIEQLVGVDLSSKMLQKSKTKAIYNELYQEDLIAYLKNSNDTYDLIAATDVFIYVGDLKEVVFQAQQRLNPGGYFAFSVESATNTAFKLTPSGRFQHSLDYLQGLSADVDFKTMSWNDVALRKEHGEVIHGYLVVMQK
jgi:predicted TPR repeat methyltransferase